MSVVQGLLDCIGIVSTSRQMSATSDSINSADKEEQEEVSVLHILNAYFSELGR